MRPPTALLLVLLLLVPLPAGLVTAAPAAAGDWAVVGGRPAPDGAHPSTVALIRAEEPDDVAGQLCGGTAIAADLVLTAAHCLHDATATSWRGAEQIRVVAGRTDLSGPGGAELAVTALFVHPGYDARRRRQDVAVLQVAGDLGVPLQPLVAAGAPDLEPGTIATVVGWGRTGPGEGQGSARTPRLHEADVPVSEDATCRSAFDGSLDLGVQMCAGGDGQAQAPAPDTCRGDSGGPLLVTDPATGLAVQHGITSFGAATCGIDEPGVYVRLHAVRAFVDDVLAGRADPFEPPAAADLQQAPVRVAAAAAGPTTAIAQAVAASRAVFADGTARLAVLARDDGFADALAGSALGFGLGPVLYTPPVGDLAPATAAELGRALEPGATVYLLGGAAAVPAAVEQDLGDRGYEVVRLAGATREGTAAAVAAAVVDRHGDGTRPPYGTVVLATSGAWPDAVVAGQLGAWWGFPVLLTPPGALHPDARAALRSMDPDRVLVVGGGGAISPDVVQMAGDLLPRASFQRLAGRDRIRTAVEVARWQIAELAARGQGAPDGAVVANLRAEGGYAHMLSATPLIGALAGVFLPVEGPAGDTITPEVAEALCGLGGLPVVIGGTDLVTDAAAGRAADVLAGIGCTPG